MMRARSGIDKTKAWADRAEEEEEADSDEESGNEGSKHASAHSQEGGGDGTLTMLDDANECAPLASAALARQIARASTPPSESHEQNKNPCNAACAHRWHAARSIYDAAPCDVKECMMYTRHCFYAAVPSNAAAYGPVEAIGAHEWASVVSMSEGGAAEGESGQETAALTAAVSAAAPPAAAKTAAKTAAVSAVAPPAAAQTDVLAGAHSAAVGVARSLFASKVKLKPGSPDKMTYGETPQEAASPPSSLPPASPPRRLQLCMRLRGGGNGGGEGGEQESMSGSEADEGGDEGSEPESTAGGSENASDADDDTVDPNRMLPKGTRRSLQKPDRYRDEDHDRLLRKDVPNDEIEAALHDSDVEDDEGEEEDEEEEIEEQPTEEDRAFIVEDDDGGDGEDSAYESMDDESNESEDESDEESQAASSESNHETDEELEQPPARHRLQRNRAGDTAKAAAEALLGRKLDGMKIMRIEAQRARDVVDGKKTLELTNKLCHQRGVVLIGETADGAQAKDCAIGAVNLGECTRMSQEAFEATADRHHALDFAPAQAWLENDTMYAQELSQAVRFDMMPVPYKQKAGARKWIKYEPPRGRSADAHDESGSDDGDDSDLALRRAVLRRLKVVRQRIEGCRCISTLRRADEMVRQLESAVAEMDGASSGDEAGGGVGGEAGGMGGSSGGSTVDEGSRSAPPSSGGAMPEDESAHLSPIPDQPIILMDMRTWGELLPKTLQDSFGPVVDLMCHSMPDVCKLTDNTVKHAMDARDNKLSKIGRAGAEISVPPDQLLLATLPDGRGGVCAAMWAVVESVQRDRRRGPHLKISVVRVVVKPEHRRGDPQLQRRNVKLELFLAIVDAGVRESCQCVALTLADADCITNKRGAMWRRLFLEAIRLRPAVSFDAEGLDEAQKGERGRVAALPCLWASPTGAPSSLPSSHPRKERHPVDEFSEQAEAELAAAGPPAMLADGTVINPLTGEPKRLISPATWARKAEKAATCASAGGDGEASRMEVEGGEGGAVEGGDADMRDASADESGEKGGGEARGSAVGGETIAHAAEPFTADGGEGGGGEGGGGEVEGGMLAVGEANGGEGGELAAAAAAEQPWAPKDTDQLFSEIATMDYGVSDDRSSKLATPAIKAYNKVAGTYEQAWQKRGQPLLEGFTIVKVRCMHRLRPC